MEVKAHVEAAARELSLERFAKFENELYQVSNDISILENVQSTSSEKHVLRNMSKFDGLNWNSPNTVGLSSCMFIVF